LLLRKTKGLCRRRRRLIFRASFFDWMYLSIHVIPLSTINPVVSLSEFLQSWLGDFICFHSGTWPELAFCMHGFEHGVGIRGI
jgi:hypothetical protein